MATDTLTPDGEERVIDQVVNTGPTRPALYASGLETDHDQAYVSGIDNLAA